jgi:CobQ/CobB/MinD/ParA family nucleotide binding protein
MSAAVIQIPKAAPLSRVVFTQGGKGGTGKTAFATALVDWYAAHNTPCALIDMDTENKSQGSLAHFFPKHAVKSNIHLERGLDQFVEVLEDGIPIVVADMGASAGEVAHEWFDGMYEAAAESGIAFTAIGIVTPDPASVASVLDWATFLQDRVDYLIVKNSTVKVADFGYWETDPQAVEFRRVFKPKVISMEYHLPDIEFEAREHGLTLNQVANRQTNVPHLSLTGSVWRAQAYRRNIYKELDSVKDLLIV